MRQPRREAWLLTVLGSSQTEQRDGEATLSLDTAHPRDCTCQLAHLAQNSRIGSVKSSQLAHNWNGRGVRVGEEDRLLQGVYGTMLS